MTNGLLPMRGTLPPWGGMLGLVLLQQIIPNPALHACHPSAKCHAVQAEMDAA